MSQLSLFNIGTGHHQGESNNLLVALHRDCTSRSASGLISSRGGNWKFINDGAGSVEEGGGIKAKIASVPGNAMGSGSTKGVVTTTDKMVELFERVNPDQVNICGHSRGAITSVRIAAKLFKISPGTPVNLFLVDPVKRMGQGTDFYNREIHPNVNRILCVVMEDVGDKGLFKFMSLKTKGVGTKRAHLTSDKFLRMPGAHGTATQVDAPIGQVTYQLARRFLASCGAPVGSGVWDDVRLCNEYFKIPARNPVVNRKTGILGRSVITRTVNDGGVDKLVSKHSRRDRLDGLGINNRFYAHAVFVNEHHFSLFKSHFPCLASNLGEGSRIGSANARLQAEVQSLKSICPQGFFLLDGLGLL
jgi:hypothetical protein